MARTALLAIALLASAAPDAASALGGFSARAKDRTVAPICPPLPRPPHEDKCGTARWMVHSLDWGVLSTISARSIDGLDGPIPFGNVYSFADGTCDNSTGVPYLYATMLDQSMIDAESNPIVSLTLSEASLSGVPEECSASPGRYGDPEMPPCGRLALTGELVRLDEEADSEELEFVRGAMMERHPSVAYWPKDHRPFAAKIDLRDAWLLDWFGGASVLDLEEYFAADPLGGGGTGADAK